MSILSTLQWLEATEFSTGIRESTYVWAYIDGVHVLGLCLFVGLTMFWDLRLLNVVMRRVPVSETASRPGTKLAVRFADGLRTPQGGDLASLKSKSCGK